MVQDSAELRQFREQWKAEVRRRREEQQVTSSEPRPSCPQTHPFSRSETNTKPPAPRSAPGISYQPFHSHGQIRLNGSIAPAVDIPLNPNVDRAYFSEDRSTAETRRKKATSASKGEGAETHITKAVEGEAPKENAHTKEILSMVVASFPKVLTFEPEDGREGTPINMIPDELLLYILRNVDTATLERFATACRKARTLSLDPSIWRDFVYMAYKPPQIPDAVALQTIVDGYNSDYRQTYIQHPRLRLDGVYIAVCHYVRNGLGENAWVNVSHLVTYHRYLRFFPDGQVLSLLANEEHQPPLVIPLLKPSLRMKGFYIGVWRLESSSILITNLIEKYPHAPSVHPGLHGQSHVPQPTRYHFQMTLTLCSKPLGRWNKLDFVSYESVNIQDGEVIPLPLKHERSFWFSKVKSWQGY